MEVKELYVTLATFQNASLPITSIDAQYSPERESTCWVKQKYQVFLSQEAQKVGGRAVLKRVSPQCMEPIYKTSLTPTSRCYEGPESPILSRTLCKLSLHRVLTLVNQPRVLAACSHICPVLSVLSGSWALAFCLSAPCGSVANLPSFSVLWILVYSPIHDSVWSHNNSHWNWRQEACWSLHQSGEGTKLKETLLVSYRIGRGTTQRQVPKRTTRLYMGPEFLFLYRHEPTLKNSNHVRNIL